jgi:hypothetical protein
MLGTVFDEGCTLFRLEFKTILSFFSNSVRERELDERGIEVGVAGATKERHPATVARPVLEQGQAIVRRSPPQPAARPSQGARDGRGRRADLVRRD